MQAPEKKSVSANTISGLKKPTAIQPATTAKTIFNVPASQKNDDKGKVLENGIKEIADKSTAKSQNPTIFTQDNSK